MLAVNKPAGVISKDVSRWLTKRIGKVKLGHVGTLDPAAGGVLPLLLGRATKLQDFLLEMPKTYEFDITFGTETDTLDQDGRIVRELPWDHLTESDLQSAIQSFVGNIEQTPPLYSAVKYKGRPLYKYVRGNDADACDVPLADLKRQVSVSQFEMLNFSGAFGSFRITCSKGTYVRSLVRDVAERLGTCGTLTRLVRTKAAGIDLVDAVNFDDIEQKIDQDAFESLVVPMKQIKFNLPTLRCENFSVVSRIKNGQCINLSFAAYEADLSREDGHTIIPSGLAMPLILVDPDGATFGVGSVRSQESGRVVIALKRGL